MRFYNLILVVVLAGFSSTGSAALLDFNDENDLGLTLGGTMKWDSRGGGHLYAENFNFDDYLFFADDTYVNSFELNGLPWIDGPLNTAGSLSIEAFDLADQKIWETSVDLSGSDTWDIWIEVPVEMAAVRSLKFIAPIKFNGTYKFWPSIDNMIINEQTLSTIQAVPLPAAVWLFGSAIGLFGWLGRRGKRQVLAKQDLLDSRLPA